MKGLATGWLPSFAPALALRGCVAVERRPESVFPGVVISTASADANAEPRGAAWLGLGFVEARV